MPVLKHKHSRNFTVIPNDLLRDKRLSLKSLGLLCHLLQLPDDWQFSVAGLEKVLPHDGRDSIKKAISEIRAAGYLKQEQGRDGGGRLSSNNWVVSDLPEFLEEGTPLAEKPLTGKPSTENPSQLNNESKKENLPPKGIIQFELIGGKEVAIIE